MSERKEEIALYAVRNSDGKWFRRKGMNGYGETWTLKFSQARIYNRIGPARGVISFFANNYPNYDSPTLVKLVVGEIVEIDETDRIQKQQEKKKQAEAKRKAEEAAWRLQEAQRRLSEAQAEVSKLKGKKNG